MAEKFHFATPDLIVCWARSSDSRVAKPFLVKGFSAADGKESFSFTAADDDRVQVTAFNQGKELAVAVEKANLLRIWDVTTQKLVREVKLADRPADLTWFWMQASADGKRFFIDGGGIWDGVSGKQVEALKYPFGGKDAGFVPSQDVYVFASNMARPDPNGSSVEAVAYDLTRKAVFARFSGHKNPITALAIAGNGKVMATGDQSGAVKIWDLGQMK